MSGNIKINLMVSGDVDEAMNLWKKQLTYFYADNPIHACWINNTIDIEKYIIKTICQGNALIAKIDGKAVGFLTYDIFKFHGADSAICHFCGNSSAIDNRAAIYLALYTEASKIWVNKGVLSHYIVICTNDSEVKNALFDLGFGAYGPYGFAHFDRALDHTSEYEISIANADDIDALHNLANQSIDYFASSPLYLKMAFSLDGLAQLIKTSTIFVAKDKGEMIGYMHVRVADQNNIYDMYTKGCLLTDKIGTFIKDEYRDKNIGSHFISEVSKFCIENHIACAHVAYESANPCANQFWKKHFTPTLLGLKRTVHPDILG